MPLKCVLFDIDGTLVETDSTHVMIMKELLEPFGHVIDEQVYKEKITGRLNPDIFREFLPEHYTQQQIIDFGNYKEEIFREKATRENLLSPIVGLPELLEDIKSKKIKCGCVTNANRPNADFMLAALEVRQYFEFVVIGDECEFGKPHPAPYLKGLELAGVKAEECIVFEDSPSGIKAARAAGIETIGITTTQTAEYLKNCGAIDTIPDFTKVNVEFLQSFFKAHHPS
eukprot:Phypoly_transcript_17724.p1 GENE.Phypoly_transcript_17724~~Phypoly_transcript_17724.p1  ORF type:complete len:228 (+),score=44.43 Phypoly_transcript_17724:100-783(+)